MCTMLYCAPGMWIKNVIYYFRDSAIIVSINCATSFYAGFAVFSVLGAMAHTLGVSVEHVVASGEMRERESDGGRQREREACNIHGLARHSLTLSVSLPFCLALYVALFPARSHYQCVWGCACVCESMLVRKGEGCSVCVYNTIHMYTGITSGRVFDGEQCPADWREIFMKQSVGKCKQINF